MSELAPTYKTRAPAIPTHSITPLEELDYTWDFTDELDEDDDTIATATVTLNTLTKYQADQYNTKKVVSFIAGAAGTVDNLYLGTCIITTALNRTFQRDRWFLVVASR